METTLEWVQQNTTPIFSHYKKSDEGAWITLQPLPNNEDNIIWNNTILAKRAHKKYSTTEWETNFLEQLLPSLIKKHHLCKNTPLLDIACGDGRISYICHRIGFKKIIGIDLDMANVNNAAVQVQYPYSNDFVFMMGDALNLPFNHQSLHQVFVSGLPSSTDFFLKIRPLMSKNSVLLYLVPTNLEAALTYALVRNDWKEFLYIIKTHTRAATWENKKYRYPVSSYKNIIAEAKQNGFHLEATYGVPIFASLIFGGICQDQKLNETEKEAIYENLHHLASEHHEFVRQHFLIFRTGLPL